MNGYFLMYQHIEWVIINGSFFYLVLQRQGKQGLNRLYYTMQKLYHEKIKRSWSCHWENRQSTNVFSTIIPKPMINSLFQHRPCSRKHNIAASKFNFLSLWLSAFRLPVCQPCFWKVYEHALTNCNILSIQVLFFFPQGSWIHKETEKKVPFWNVTTYDQVQQAFGT